MSENEPLFNLETPLGFFVRTSREYWEKITTVKHPSMRNKLVQVMENITDPATIRVSKSDKKVFLFYRSLRPENWICAVLKRLNGEGFLITSYITVVIKEGKEIWKK